MTTRHRATSHAAMANADGRGGGRAITKHTSTHIRDLPSFNTLKRRKPDHLTHHTTKQLKETLLAKERLKLNPPPPPPDDDNDAAHDDDDQTKLIIDAADADDAALERSIAAPLDDSSDGSDDEEDQAELMRELERIKQERVAEAERKADEERREREAAMLTGNPLLADVSDGCGADFSVKRRWGDDAIFKNQARDEPKHEAKRFINDTVRNDFHRKFLKRYIR